ncbi:MAG: hypothetical protein CMK74_00695 [Pseudomonadales bacterium]|nr:hypothetical protein [Pseudomonadales bacterium]|tara:strand:- start:108 stop:512 length:405 start_codon:yes stop_codon:yes gene_type:complete
MKVTVTEECSRCHRKAPREVDSGEIAELEARAAKREEAVEHVKKFFTENEPEGGFPDLVVFFKGEVQTMTEVCAAFCDKTVRNALATAFREAKPRKGGRPKKKKTTTDASKTKKTAKKASNKKAATSEVQETPQ